MCNPLWKCYVLSQPCLQQFQYPTKYPPTSNIIKYHLSGTARVVSPIQLSLSNWRIFDRKCCYGPRRQIQIQYKHEGGIPNPKVIIVQLPSPINKLLWTSDKYRRQIKIQKALQGNMSGIKKVVMGQEDQKQELFMISIVATHQYPLSAFELRKQLHTLHPSVGRSVGGSYYDSHSFELAQLPGLRARRLKP